MPARVALVVLAVALLPAAGCRDAGGPAPTSVLLITVDTLRPDALGFIGGRTRTPAVDRLAAEGFAFPSATAPVPITLPSHASLLTGRIPPRHGVRDNGQTLGAGVETLAETLREAGFATGAFVSGFPLQAMFGLDRGFETYDDTLTRGTEGWLERPAPETAAAAAAWIGRQDGPWFAWVHFYDPHDPYEPPRTFWRPGSRGAYDGEVEFTDHAIGELLDAVPDAQRRDLLTVFTADHGESLGEHDEHQHGFFVYQSTLAVPLILHHPAGIRPGASDAAVRLVDVAPTIADLLGLSGPDAVDGVSIRPTLSGRDQVLPPTYFETELPWRYFGWAPLYGIRDGDWKLVAAPRSELYDLSRDPAESVNLIDGRARQAQDLRDLLDGLEKEGTAAEVVEDPAVLERLIALGYLGGGASDGVPAAGLPDPKDRIGLREKLSQAEALLRGGDPAGAVELFDEVLREEPINRAAALRSGIALLRMGELPRAVERLEAAVALDPQRSEARFALGDALMRAGRPEPAAQQWMELARLQPRRAEAWSNLGAALMQLGRHDEALAAFTEAAGLAPDDPRHRQALEQARTARR